MANNEKWLATQTEVTELLQSYETKFIAQEIRATLQEIKDCYADIIRSMLSSLDALR